MESAPARLRTKPSWLINKLSPHAHRLIGEHLASTGAHGYHFAVLATLDEFGPASQARIGQRTGIDRSDTHTIISELAGAGYVVREPDPADRRRNVITITGAGRTRLRQLDEAIDAAQAELVKPLDESEREQLVRLLGKVLAHHITGA